MDFVDRSVELYPKLSFICQTDESLLIPKWFNPETNLVLGLAEGMLNQYKPDSFQFYTRNDSAIERLVLTKEYIEGL